MDQISEIVEDFSIGANSIEETNTALAKIISENKLKQAEEVSLINDYVTQTDFPKLNWDRFAVFR